MKIDRLHKILAGCLAGAILYSANMYNRLSNVISATESLSKARTMLQERETEYHNFQKMVDLDKQLSDESPVRQFMWSNTSKEEAEACIRSYEEVRDLANTAESAIRIERRKALFGF